MDAFAQLVPFGKYRGQDFSVLLADTAYIQWLLSQSWFAERYPAIHMTIINNGAEPTETPEHNAMQLLFLEEKICRAVVDVAAKILPSLYPRQQKILDNLYPSRRRDTLHVSQEFFETQEPRIIASTGCDDFRYEVHGIDVSFVAEFTWRQPYTHYVDVTTLPVRRFEAFEAYLSRRRYGYGYVHGHTTPTPQELQAYEQQYWDEMHKNEATYQAQLAALPEDFRAFLVEEHSSNETPVKRLKLREDGSYLGREEIGQRKFTHKIHINCELKPSLGDDYPATLRQILTACKRQSGHAVVICDTWAARGGTFAQVQQLFQRSGVALLPLAAVQDCAATLQ